jgi:DNA-binding SARP family transcriptional activator
VLYRVLGEESLRLTDESEIAVPASYRRAAEVGVVIPTLPHDATLPRLGAVLWPKASEKAARANIYRALSNLRHVFRDVLGDGDAERIVETVGGVCRWNDALVSIDAQEFLRAIKGANLHRAAGETARRSGDTNARARATDAAIADYEDARGWYGGELLPGQEHRYLWLDQPIKGELTPRALYAQLHSETTRRLAELLMESGRHAEAAARYEELLADPGPPDGRSDDEQARYEAFARALYRCCGALHDRRRLERAHERLLVALHKLDVEGRSKERTSPSGDTMVVYDAMTRQLQAAVGDSSAD